MGRPMGLQRRTGSDEQEKQWGEEERHREDEGGGCHGAEESEAGDNRWVQLDQGEVSKTTIVMRRSRNEVFSTKNSVIDLCNTKLKVMFFRIMRSNCFFLYD
ncbi:hypothetical protein KSP40_PGU016004 [Platanthera guangdongensis]|uniref:Uncharacterized protein n=1 Tax=Platanthera guangdongensis TaxID=2320717 RepID=A0ABR2M0B2_9ASPA